MSRISNGILCMGASLLLALTTTSCDIEPQDRFVELPPIDVQKTVLLMDFTGQRCVNCPEAHEVMQELVKQYGDTALITVSIHAGGLALSVDRTNFEYNNIGLMIEQGNEMNNAFGITSWPMGVVDRINDPGAALNSGEWAAAVRNAFSVPTDVKITANADLVGDKINIKASAISESDRDAALQLWIVEDSISARQDTKNGRVNDYIHNNVLRDVVYSVSDGAPLTLRKGIWTSDSTSVTTKWTDKERWNTRNLSVVAFVFQGTSILNAVRVPVQVPE